MKCFSCARRNDVFRGARSPFQRNVVLRIPCFVSCFILQFVPLVVPIRFLGRLRVEVKTFPQGTRKQSPITCEGSVRRVMLVVTRRVAAPIVRHASSRTRFNCLRRIAVVLSFSIPDIEFTTSSIRGLGMPVSETPSPPSGI